MLKTSAPIGKRDATPEESEAMLQIYAQAFPDYDYRTKEAEAIAEGANAEVCDCGRCLPACVHFVRCEVPCCPMRGVGGKSLLDILFGSETQEGAVVNV